MGQCHGERPYSLNKAKVVPFWVSAGLIRLLGSQLHIVSTWGQCHGGRPYSLNKAKVVPLWVGAGLIRLLGSQLHIVSTWGQCHGGRPYSLNKAKVVPLWVGAGLIRLLGSQLHIVSTWPSAMERGLTRSIRWRYHSGEGGGGGAGSWISLGTVPDHLSLSQLSLVICAQSFFTCCKNWLQSCFVVMSHGYEWVLLIML